MTKQECLNIMGAYDSYMCDSVLISWVPTTPIRMILFEYHGCLQLLYVWFCLKIMGAYNSYTYDSVTRRRRWLISKSSFSRQCVGRIRDTCTQLTSRSHSPHTHRGNTFRPTYTPVKLCINMSHLKTSPNLKFIKRRRRLLISALPVHWSYSWLHTASWHETYVHAWACQYK